MLERMARRRISVHHMVLLAALLALTCLPPATAQETTPSNSPDHRAGQPSSPSPSSQPATSPVPKLPAKDLVRGAWVHPDVSRDAATGVPQIQKRLDACAATGINTIILMVKDTAGAVCYKSAIATADPAWNYDCLEVWLKEAKLRNITIHPWFCVFNEASVLGRTREHPDWFVMNRHGERTDVLNPALPQARQYELSLMMEVATHYPVDWIHLDYIRFPCAPAEPYFSYDAPTRKLFKDYSGWDPLEIKAQDSGNIVWNEWLEWNRDQVTQFVRELRESLKTTGRTVRISAAVFPNADNARVLIGQDWPKWAESGLVDMLCPMLYTNHAGFFEKDARQAVGYGKGHCLVCPGIGIGTSHNQNTPEGMLEQMRICRELNADGVIFFSGNSLTEPFLEKLRAAK